MTLVPSNFDPAAVQAAAILLRLDLEMSPQVGLNALNPIRNAIAYRLLKGPTPIEMAEITILRDAIKLLAKFFEAKQSESN